jgi:hypothetical protein
MSLRLLGVSATFLVFAVISSPANAQSAPEPNFEVGAQTSLLRLSDSGTTSVGFGGRFSWDLLRHASADAEASFFPQDNFVVSSQGLNGDTLRVAYHRRRSELFGGIKFGLRGSRFGLFGKTRPGLTRLTHRGFDCAGSMCPLAVFMLPEYTTEFALDLGGIVEFYPTRRMVARLDFGDVMIRHRSIGVPPCSDCWSNNFRLQFGVGMKF